MYKNIPFSSSCSTKNYLYAKKEQVKNSAKITKKFLTFNIILKIYIRPYHRTKRNSLDHFAI